MNLVDAITQESKRRETENGAYAESTTGSFVLDFFSQLGNLRTTDYDRIRLLTDLSWSEDTLLTIKALFYGRDILQGLGERRMFRVALHHLAIRHPEDMGMYIDLIPEYGRFDDWYALVETPLESMMWCKMSHQLERDKQAMAVGKPISLLAKWVKHPNTRNKAARKLGYLTAYRLGYEGKNFTKLITSMREYLRVTEHQIGKESYSEIDYEHVPSKASKRYQDLFLRKDNVRYRDYLDKLSKGKAKVNAKTLTPQDVIHPLMLNRGGLAKEEVILAEKQWEALPNFVKKESASAIVVADTSGSMFEDNAHPIATAIGLALYFAERNTGIWHNRFITFSDEPACISLNDTMDFLTKVAYISRANWGFSTNIEAVFKLVLDLAVENKIRQEDMVDSIIIVSDMQFNPYHIMSNNELFHSAMKRMFAEEKYELPNLVFWNASTQARQTFHASADIPGVQLCSGQSAANFKYLMESVGLTPYEMMKKTLDSERYDVISNIYKKKRNYKNTTETTNE